ncbi:putative J domain-containing protein [Lachnellula suecica]|uniref:Putative J domain-containing protein n=1 Tax=Lachnellula suecica TaxID=602035 RepID=A0A8T9CBY4_9HELO|nr:putative J domain-containing protein [Lachnellula suecica]
MFNRFFGGGGMGGFGGGGLFNESPGFVFNMNGGPGIRVHQFGGRAPRRRPRDPNAPEEPPPSLRDILKGLLPLLIVLILPLLSSIFSGSGSSSGPSMRFDGAVPPHTMSRHTNKMKVDYWLNPVEVDGFTSRQFHHLDQTAEIQYVQQLRVFCEEEMEARSRLVQEAQGWFVQDTAKMHKAKNMEMANCRKLESLGLLRN